MEKHFMLESMYIFANLGGNSINNDKKIVEFLHL